VISAVDLDDIYKIPSWLHQQGLDEIVVDKLRLEGAAADLASGTPSSTPKAPGRRQVDVAMVGKYVDPPTPTSR
jgi:CTP synthase